MKLLTTGLLLLSFNLFSQNWTSDGICDFESGVQWNNGGSASCACTWYTIENGDTVVNCAFGDCGQSDLLECTYDCNGHNGNPTNSIPRQCDINADPICWFQGAGNTAGVDFCARVLPVEFIGMDGYTDGNSNYITWSTATEYNCSHYTIERSVTGQDFDLVAVVQGSGTVQFERNYRARDISAPVGVSYYRLTQYDYNGQYAVLGVMAIDNRPKEILKVINSLGQVVDVSYEGLKIIFFKDGTKTKTYE